MNLIGIDECNYSPSLAGDCIVVAYYAKRIIKGVTDSKKLTHEKRLELFSKLQRWGHYQVQIASVNEINDIGIYLARNRAIIQAIRGLMSRLQPTQKVRVIIDGKFSKAWLARMGSPGIEVECMIKGDEKIYEFLRDLANSFLDIISNEITVHPTRLCMKKSERMALVHI